MPEITAREAAELLGVSERTTRRHIKAGKIPARKEQPNRYAIDTASLPAAPLPRKGVAGQVAQLSAQLAAATKRLDEMQAEIDKLKATPAPYRPYTPPPRADSELAPLRRYEADVLADEPPIRRMPPPPALAPITRGSRAGWIRVRQFARNHNVPDGTLVSQLNIFHLEHEAVATRAQDGRHERWLTPVQQDKLVLFWDENGTAYERCQECATGHSHQTRNEFADLDRELALD